MESRSSAEYPLFLSQQLIGVPGFSQPSLSPGEPAAGVGELFRRLISGFGVVGRVHGGDRLLGSLASLVCGSMQALFVVCVVHIGWSEQEGGLSALVNSSTLWTGGKE